MVVLGVDPHKDGHTVVAVDQNGRQLAQLTVSARTGGLPYRVSKTLATSARAMFMSGTGARSSRPRQRS